MKKWNYRVTVYTQTDTFIITNPITCKGTVTKAVLSENNTANIQLYNLAPSTRSGIYQDPLTLDPLKQKLLKVEVGYGEDNTMSQIFFGRILQAYSKQAGGSTDIITVIEAVCLDLLYCQSSVTFKAGTSKKEAIKILANDLPHCAIGSIGKVEGEFQTDTTFEGNTVEQINKIAGGGAFVDDGLINVCLLNEVLDVPVPVITSDNYLLETPIRKEANLDVNFIMIPDIILGQLLEIASVNFSNFNGQYKVIGFSHNFTFSESSNIDARTTANLFIGPLLPSQKSDVNEETSQENFCKIKGEKVTPVLYQTPASVADVYRYMQKNNGKIPNTKITPNISWVEMLGHNNTDAERKKECTIPLLTNVYVTATTVQKMLNKYYPGRKITITSGWRSARNNAACGGAARSQHLFGRAMDFLVGGVSVPQLGNLVASVWDGGYQYKDPRNRFIHVDTRSYKTTVNDL